VHLNDSRLEENEVSAMEDDELESGDARKDDVFLRARWEHVKVESEGDGLVNTAENEEAIDDECERKELKQRRIRSVAERTRTRLVSSGRDSEAFFVLHAPGSSFDGAILIAIRRENNI
jgi:hypothetical protein